MSEQRSKNAYEIRSDILGLARGIVFDAYYAKKDAAASNRAEVPTVEDVVLAANKLYEFVNQNTSKSA